jgi:hypothetical protein
VDPEPGLVAEKSLVQIVPMRLCKSCQCVCAGADGVGGGYPCLTGHKASSDHRVSDDVTACMAKHRSHRKRGAGETPAAGGAIAADGSARNKQRRMENIVIS